MAVPSSPNPVIERLRICAFTSVEAIAADLEQQLDPTSYELIWRRSRSEFIDTLQQQRQQIDCLVLHEEMILPDMLSVLQEQGTLLPAVILTEQGEAAPHDSALYYHTAELHQPVQALEMIADVVDQAINAFLELLPQCPVLPTPPGTASVQSTHADQATTEHFVQEQQQRLADKLRERLGYVGVYYKRNPKGFLRSMPQDDREAFLKNLRLSYREIILSYFREDPTNNQKLDTFVDTVFLADLPIAKVVEIHMDLIDDFSKQLKLEGRSEEVLLDYRLTLIDTLAHLCEMYRRCIPREIPEP